MKNLEREIDALMREEAKLLDDYLKDIISPEVLKIRAKQVQLAQKQKREDLRALEEQQKAREDATMAGERIAEYCQQFQEGLDELDEEGRRALFSAFGVRVTVTKEELEVMLTVNPGATVMSPPSP